MPNKFIAMADLHCFQMSNQATSHKDGVSDRLEDVGYCLRETAKYARTNGITSLYLLGDTFHNKGLISVTVYNYVYKLVKELRDTFDTITIIGGNHDQARNSQDDVSILGLSDLANIVTRPIKVYQDGMNIQFVPYFDKNTIGSWGNVVDTDFTHDAPNVLMGHFGIEGARYSGFEVRAVGELSLSDIRSEEYDLVLLGHYHEPQTLSPRAYYVGAPLQHTFADEGSRRGFRVVSLTEGRRGIEAQVELVPIEGTPKFLTLTKEEYNSVPRGARDFVRLTGVDRSQLTLMAQKDSRICGAKTLEVAPTAPKSGVKLGGSMQSTLNAYLDYAGVSESQKKELQTVGEQLLSEAGVVGRAEISHNFKFKISCSGYKAFGETPVEVDFSQQGLTLIRGINTSSSGRGSNGSGKTTIFESLVFGLFGKTGKALKSDLVNAGCDTGRVVVDVSRGDGAKMVITREFTRTSRGNRLYADVAYPDGSTTQYTGSAAVVQADIEGFLGLSKDTFLLALFCVSSVGEMTPAVLSEIFEEILDLEVYRKAYQITKLGHTQVTKELSSIEARLEENERREQAVLADIENIEKVRDSLVPPSTSVSEVEEKIDSVTSELAEKETLATTIGQKFIALDAELGEITASISKAQSELHRADVEVARAESELRTANRDYTTKVVLFESGKCPTCTADTQTDTLSTEISHLKQEVERHTLEVNRLIEVRNLAKQEQDKYTGDRLTVGGDFNKVLSLKSATDQLISDLKLGIAKLELAKEAAVGAKALYATQVAGYNSLVYSAEDKLLLIEEEGAELRATKQTSLEPRLSELEFWLTGFSPSGIPNLLIDSTLPELNKLAKVYSDILTGGEIQVQFTSSTETASGSARDHLGVVVDDLYGYNTYDNASSGEKRRIDIILSLALQRFVSIRQNLGMVLLDEVFVKLDREGEEAVMSLLRHMLDAIPSIFVISNKELIKNDHFDNVLTVVRRGQKSELLEEA